MKRKSIITLALVASITSTAFAGFNAPLPEFKTPKQLAEWRAEMAAKSDSKTTTTQDTAFYTGKPYLESSANYAFKYRSYNPELARWTSEDPSGFPDGPNGNIYAARPTNELDPYGLDNVFVTGTGQDVNGTPLSIKFGSKSQLVGVIAAKMDVTWSLSGTQTGWIVQKVVNDVSKVYNDSDNSQYIPHHPPTPVYWEAWRVDAGFKGQDSWNTIGFIDTTHGEVTKNGTACFYEDSAVTSDSPATWLTTAVPDTGGLPGKTTSPSWWTGSGVDHNLKMTWE